MRVDLPRLRRTAAVTATVLAAACAPALATSSVGVTVTPANPIDDVPVNAISSGHADADADVLSYTRGVGAPGCPATPDELSGDHDELVVRDTTAAGDFSVGSDATAVFWGVGDHLLCSWLMASADDTVLATAAQTVGVVRATTQLAVDAPKQVAADRGYAVHVGFASNAGRVLSVDVRPAAAGPCAALPEQEPADATWLVGPGITAKAIGPDDAPAGTMDLSLDPPGANRTQQICAWIVRQASGGIPSYADNVAATVVRSGSKPRSWIFKGRSSGHRRVRIDGFGSYLRAFRTKATYHCNGRVRRSNGRRWKHRATLRRTSQELHGAAFGPDDALIVTSERSYGVLILELHRDGTAMTGRFREIISPVAAGLRADRRTLCRTRRETFKLHAG